jgi:hypothetical protein
MQTENNYVDPLMDDCLDLNEEDFQELDDYDFYATKEEIKERLWAVEYEIDILDNERDELQRQLKILLSEEESDE